MALSNIGTNDFRYGLPVTQLQSGIESRAKGNNPLSLLKSPELMKGMRDIANAMITFSEMQSIDRAFVTTAYKQLQKHSSKLTETA